MPGWDWRWHAEIEAFPSAVMAARHPASRNLGDVNADDFVERAAAAGRTNVLVFGSPCQDFSVAGRRIGLDGARGNLALVGLGIARALRPCWLVFENVPGLLSSYSGGLGEDEQFDAHGGRHFAEDSDFGSFLTAVRECGYLGAYRVFDAQFAGVPQRRRRVFFVGYLGDWRPAAAVLFEPEGLRGDHPPSRAAGERTAGTVKTSLARCSADEGECDTLLADPITANEGKTWTHEGKTFRPHNLVSPPLRAGDVTRSAGALHGTDADTAESLIVTGAVSAKWSKGTGGPAGDECYNLIAFDETQITSKTNRSQPDDRAPQLAGTARAPTVAFSCKDHGADAGETAPTLRSMEFDGSHANGGGQLAVAVGGLRRMGSPQGGDGPTISDTAALEANHWGQSGIISTAVRRLTPRECERLQAFPDDYTLIKYRGKPAADGPRYRALGNSMCVNDVRWILTRIESFEGLKR